MSSINSTNRRPLPVGTESGARYVSPVLPSRAPAETKAAAAQGIHQTPAPARPANAYLNYLCGTPAVCNGPQPTNVQNTRQRLSPVGSEHRPPCDSVMSDWSTERHIDFNVQPPHLAEGLFPEQLGFSCHRSAPEDGDQLNPVFENINIQICRFVRKELIQYQRALCNPELREMQRDKEEEQSRVAFREFAVGLLRSAKQEPQANLLLSCGPASISTDRLKQNLRSKCRYVFEGIPDEGNSCELHQIYTEIFIAEGGTGEVNNEHEVRQIQRASRNPHRPDKAIELGDIFTPAPGSGVRIRTVMTKGVAGIGKTVLTKKFCLDWAEGTANQDKRLMFPFTFRELNTFKEKISLLQLVHLFFNETINAGICMSEDFQVVFILDGLDECRFSLDFVNTKILSDVTKSTSVDVLLTNLIRGNLLPSAHVWITTRPAAVSTIPVAFVDRVTEVRGFTDPQKKKYFNKRIRDEEQAKKIISHIQKSRSLHIMCHIPIFCWITAKVMEDVMKRTSVEGRMPAGLTEMYILFLVVQSRIKDIKYDKGDGRDPHWSPESKEMMESLGKLAFQQLQTGKLIFYESDLRECGIDIRAASWHSGVFTQIFKEERGLYRDTAFCFIHLSVQEFLAALHVHQTFIISGVNLLSEGPLTGNATASVTQFYSSAVDQALRSPNGHLDLFLRFLLGLSLKTNQKMLAGLLTPAVRSPQSHQETVEYIKKKIEESPSGERVINLFHCLKELDDSSLVEEVQQFLGSGSLSKWHVSPAQWSALVFILLSSGLDVFDLKKFSASEEALLRLLPVVKASEKALLSDCELSEKSCEALASALCSESCNLRNLDLSTNNLQDSGVKLLSVGLTSQQCRLDILRLSCCGLSERSCEELASVLSSPSCRLRELDLSNNDLKDSGVEMLAVGLKSPHLALDILRLSGCLITAKGCCALTSALSSTFLRELDLSYNHPGVPAEKLLQHLMKDPQSFLKVQPAGAQWLSSGLKKYSCDLTIDPDTVTSSIQLSQDQRWATLKCEADEQVLCRESLTGRCYWEVEWRGRVQIMMRYGGRSLKSWGLSCVDGEEVDYTIVTDDSGTPITCPSFTSMIQSYHSSSCITTHRVAVYLDHDAGKLSFYKVSSASSLVHIHTIPTTFTEPLYLGFTFLSRPGSSVQLCPPAHLATG